ncbi:nuclease-related domain-containing protein [Kineococcus sp. SYSU DK002]|uniref:nuclease-related domain-containing protein n=1 Tax=Kineococcus sp. SYSU DK002 TaxID=3383123 RepID=UPI003D7E9814
MGIAGGGAQEQARRATARVAQLRRELTAAERSQHAWSAGAEGERLVAQALDGLDGHGWRVLHDVHWPGRRYANLDHVAIGPGGVVVVDAKKWSGDVRLDDGDLRQNGYRRDRELDGVARATADVAALLPPRHRSAARGVLCLADQPLRPARTRSGVRVVGRTHLAGHLRSLDRRLTPREVGELTEFLRGRLDGDRSPELPTTAAVGAPRSRRTVREDLLALLLALVVLVVASMLLTHLLARTAAPLGAGG